MVLRARSAPSPVWCWLLLTVATGACAEASVGYGLAFLSCAVVTLSYWLVIRTTLPFQFSRITISGFWYLTYLAMIFLPALFVYSEQEGPYRGRFLFAVESALITVPLGWLIAGRVYDFSRWQDELHFEAPVITRGITAKHRRLFLALLGLALVVTLLYLREVETVPLLYLFRNPGDYLQLVSLREESFKLLGSPLTYAYYLVRSLLYPMLILISLGCYLATRGRLWLFLFVSSFVAGVLYAALSLAKAPVAIVCALLGFYFYYFRRGRLPKRLVAFLLALTLLFPFVVVLSVSSADSGVGPQEALQGIASRLFYVPAEVAYYYFEVFPKQMPYLHGRSINKLARLLMMTPFDTPNYIGQYAYPSALESISANAVFLGDLNADFGLWGVLLGGIAAGFVMQALHIHVFRRPKTVFSLACYSFLVVAFWFLHSTSLPVVLLSDGAILAVCLAWLFERAGGNPRKVLGTCTYDAIAGTG